MGDLIHNLPLVGDLLTYAPDAQIDWVAEEAYVPIPAMHSGLNQVIPIAWRRWRRQLGSAATWREMRAFRDQLQATRYDWILDTQGLYKSALLGRLAHGPLAGGDALSIKEPGAARFYQKRLPIDWSRHVIDRCRAVGAGVFGYDISTPPRFGIRTDRLQAGWLPRDEAGQPLPYAVLMQAASRPEKLWDENSWRRIGEWLSGQGIACCLPWGNDEERRRCELLAGGLPMAVVPPFMTLDVVAPFLAGAEIVVGLDTGLTHIAAALGRPTVGVFCDSDSVQAAVYGDAFCESFGQRLAPPDFDTVFDAVRRALASR